MTANAATDRQTAPDRPYVLIVDDAPENLRTLTDLLRDDYAIAVANGGERALDLARRQPQPDLILLDIRMPDMDGYEVLEQLKQDPATYDIPVIFVTALTELAAEQCGYALGVSDYITKPVDPDLLRRRLRAQLDLRRYRRNSALFGPAAAPEDEVRPTLLLVDDIPENLHELAESLKEDYRIMVASSGERAIRLAAGPTPPDLILLDIMMPEMDGYETCRRIKALPAGERIPIIFLTVIDATREKIRGFEAGGTDYIVKPFEIDEVRARVRTHLELSRLRRFLEGQVERHSELLKLSEEKYRVLAEYSPNWEFWRAPDLSFRYVSPACRAITGYIPADFLNDPGLMDRIVHPDDLPLWRAHLSCLGESGSQPLSFRIIARDGGERFLEHKCIPVFDEAGRFQGRRGANRDITGRRAVERQADQPAHRDPLTGLPNRVLFFELLDQAIRQARHERQSFALLALDLDAFKTINDRFGSALGDRMLQAASARLRTLLPEVEMLARTGGDEFVIAVARAPDLPGIDLVARRLLDDLAQPFTLDDRQVQVGASVGIALYPEDGGEVETLWRNVNAALDQAKEQGAGRLRFFSPELTSQACDRLTLESDLRHALARDALRLHYQPQIELADGRLLGVEALLRWNHPERGLMFPAQFIPFAEESGLMIEIGDWVLRTACRQMRQWQDAGLAPPRIAINVSVHQLCHGDFPSAVREALAAAGIPPARLEIEIAERLPTADRERVARALREVRALGVSIAIDDFGTGCSPLTWLQNIEARTLKIDLSFVRDMTINPRSAAIVGTCVALAHGLGPRALAEGVETQEQAEALRTLGCDDIQGYLIARALPAAAMTDFLAALRADPAQA